LEGLEREGAMVIRVRNLDLGSKGFLTQFGKIWEFWPGRQGTSKEGGFSHFSFLTTFWVNLTYKLCGQRKGVKFVGF